MRLLWTDPDTGRPVIGTHPPEGVPVAEAPPGATPNSHWLNPAVGVAEPAPPRPGRGHLLDGRKGTWTDPLTPAERRGINAAKRQRLLDESDRHVLPDAPGDQQAWRAYRKALRDMTIPEGDVLWPPQPTVEGTAT